MHRAVHYVLRWDWNLPLNDSQNRFLFRNYAPLKNTFTTTLAWNISRTIHRVFWKSGSVNGYFQKIGNSRYSVPSGHDFLVTLSCSITRQTRVPSQSSTFENISIIPILIRIDSTRNFNWMYTLRLRLHPHKLIDWIITWLWTFIRLCAMQICRDV